MIQDELEREKKWRRRLEEKVKEKNKEIYSLQTKLKKYSLSKSFLSINPFAIGIFPKDIMLLIS